MVLRLPFLAPTLPAYLERAEGSIIGGAIGDALGHPTEFLSLNEIRSKYGSEGVRDFVLVRNIVGEPVFPAGTYTDDTQMTIAIAKALLDTKAGYKVNLAAALNKRFVEWMESPDNNRAPGNACLRGCQKLKRGLPWYLAGEQNSKGCGAVMRIASIGIVYHAKPEQLDDVAHFSAILTHRHPTAYAAAIVGARIVAAALQAQNPETFKQTIINSSLQDLPANGREVESALRKIPKVLHLPPDQAFKELGEGWIAEEALAGALYCVLSTSNFEEAVLRAINTQGDSDSLGAIAGNIAGALYGVKAIPPKWVQNVENSKYLLALASDVAKLAQEVSKTNTANGVITVHDPDLIQFPEIKRAAQDPQASVDLFIMMVESPPKGVKPFFRNEAYKNWHRDLLKDPRLNLYVKFILGIITGPIIDFTIQDEYASELTKWGLQNGIDEKASIQGASEAALRDLEKRLKKKYVEWRKGLKTEEWAIPYMQQHQPGWVEELKSLKGLSNESVPEEWHADYEKFILGFVGLNKKYIEKLGWTSPIVEWYFVGHAFFLQQHLGTGN